LNRLTVMENELDATTEVPLTRCYDVTSWTWDRACTGYRLPTEAEWEYAVRAGTRTMYFFGNRTDELCTYGNGDGSTCDDRFKKLAPVASYLPNPWGLFDMQGNVYEWVWDEQGKRRNEIPESGQDAVMDSDRRVLRGGSFLTAPSSMRSASRAGDWPGDTDYDYGFRCARSISRNH
jgi:formylglycine-generating enzyme required for sulfatase activity